jgi:hypothetical protein
VTFREFLAKRYRVIRRGAIVCFLALAAGLIIGKHYRQFWWLPIIGFAGFGVMFVALHLRLRCPRCDASFFRLASSVGESRWPRRGRFDYCPRCCVNFDDELQLLTIGSSDRGG